MTLKHRRQFTREFKLQVQAEIIGGKSLASARMQYFPEESGSAG